MFFFGSAPRGTSGPYEPGVHGPPGAGADLHAVFIRGQPGYKHLVQGRDGRAAGAVYVRAQHNGDLAAAVGLFHGDFGAMEYALIQIDIPGRHGDVLYFRAQVD